ncbi:PREDICTED: MLO-like protein 4 [Fragaria vesca subsp. vesca]|uniref:MLO-like protein 4 n=1 Tax=Fragaria vesca subsp. vesca TaxID=101020 RepID=UPI0002C2E251|nr:PREDICTED: MLO-like protein 4 [Fragaria vesca subsp. vesca]
MEGVIQQQRSLAETPTYSVASVVTVMVFVCLLVQRSIYRFGKWLKKTRRKALFASLEKIKEELMLLGLISLLLAQSARWISEICVNSSLFTSQFYICSEKDYSNTNEKDVLETSFSSPNVTDIPAGLINLSSHQCGEGREPFVSYEGLEQLHRFLFVLGITHVLYSCVAVGLAMSKIYSWRKWENQAGLLADANLQAKKNKVMRRQSTFVFQHTSHPWSRHRILIWMLCFLRQFKSSVQRSDYLALRLGFITKHRLPHSYNFHKYVVRSMEDEFQGILGISWPLWGYAIVCIFVNVHGLNIYFWLSFIPAILVMVVGTKLQHVVSSLALEIVEQTGPTVGTQVKPRDDLFWFGKPVILLRLIQFIIFQNAFEMATFLWSLWGLKERSCFMKNHIMIVIRLASGVLVQFWCSHSTVPLNVIVTQMGSRCKKALVAESVRESLHSWCKRVKERSKHSHATRSVCSLDTTIDERDEITVVSGTLSRSSSLDSLHQVTVASMEQPDTVLETTDPPQHEYSFRVAEYLADSVSISTPRPTTGEIDDDAINGEEEKVDTLLELFQKT